MQVYPADHATPAKHQYGLGAQRKKPNVEINILIGKLTRDDGFGIHALLRALLALTAVSRKLSK
jgi:hypothetical protein